MNMILADIKKTLGTLRYKLFGMEKFYILERFLQNATFNKVIEDTKKISIPYDFTQLTSDSKDLLEKYMKFSDEVRKEKVNDWFKNGNICLLLLVNNEIAGSLWITTKAAPYSYIPKVAELFNDSSYIFKLFIDPPFRRKGLAVIFGLRTLQFCQEIGIPKTGAIVYEHNKPSLRLLKRLGYKRTNKLYLLRVGPFSHGFLRSLS